MISRSRRAAARSGKQLTVAAVLSVFVAVAVGCGSNQSGSSSTDGNGASGSDTLSKIKSQGYAQVGVVSVPPFGQLLPDGSIVGVGPDITKAVLHDMGIDKVKGVQVTSYGTLVPALKAGKFDIYGGTFKMVSNACKEVRFGLPLVTNPYSAAVLKSSGTKPASSFKEMGQSGTSVGTIKGNNLISEGYYERNGIETVREYPDILSEIDAMKAGRVDTIVMTTSAFMGLPGDQLDQIVLGPTLSDIPNPPSSVVFRKSDAALQQAFNEKLRAFEHTDEYAQILRKYNFPVAENIDEFIDAMPEGCQA